MGRKQIDSEIDGVKFRVTTLPFGKSKGLLVFLGKKVGPALSALAGSLTLESAVPALAGALENLNESDLDHVMDVLTADACVVLPDGRTPLLCHADVREEVFGGRVLLFFRFLAFALEVNYADFFAAARKSAPGKDPEAKTTTGSPA
jgi:hypothetical protein